MTEKVFINYVPDDIDVARSVKKQLEQVGISCYLPPTETNPVVNLEIVEKIKQIGGDQGCMLFIFSEKASASSVFISNIQLMSEVAGKNRVLIRYQVEDVKNDQQVRLFYSQAHHIINRNDLVNETAQIIRWVNKITEQEMQPVSKNPLRILFQTISKNVIIGLVVAVIFVSVAAAVIYNLINPFASTSVQPTPVVLPTLTPTPVVMYVPFSGESKDSGLSVDARFVPSYLPEKDPAMEAPFSYKPKYILVQDDFSDPKYENSYNGAIWAVNWGLDEIGSMDVSQMNGILQLAVAPQLERQTELRLDSRLLYTPDQCTYLAYRFRMDDYQGIKQPNTNVIVNAVFQLTKENSLEANFNLIDQSFSGFQTGDSKSTLDSDWHTLEIISQAEKQNIDIYLDGKKVGTRSLNQIQSKSWMNYVFFLSVSNTNDWVRFQLDEIIFGASEPISEKELPEDVPYHFTPSQVDYQENFDTQAYQQFLVNGNSYVKINNGVLEFNIPSGKEDIGIGLEVPISSTSETNYLATRYRYTSPNTDYWSNWGGFTLLLFNPSFQNPEGYSPQIEVTRLDERFAGWSCQSCGLQVNAYIVNSQPSQWHTLEMVMKRSVSNSNQYRIAFWIDGNLLGEDELSDAEKFLNESENLFAAIRINSGRNRHEAFSGEIDNLTTGFLDPTKAQE